MSKLEKAIEKIAREFAAKEKRQDAVLQLNRLIVRECASAIKSLHQGDIKQAKVAVAGLKNKIESIKKQSAEDFEGISQTALQEYVEAACLVAYLEKREPPTFDELGVPALPWLTGLADCSGELRRALQLALRDDKLKDAEYYFEQMNELYDNLMTLKFASSLVGPLKRKQDVLRSQLEAARSELLRAKS